MRRLLFDFTRHGATLRLYTRYTPLSHMMIADARFNPRRTGPLDPINRPAAASMKNHAHELRMHANVNAAFALSQ